jgi:c-di-GMP-binding flagellar brake protein YcgR
MDSAMLYFRVSAVLPVAIEARHHDDEPAPPTLVMGGSLANEARLEVERIGSRQPDQYREALNAVLDVVETLERQVEMLHRRMVLDFRKLDLVRRRVKLGGEGLLMEDPLDFSEDQLVRLHILLPIRGGRSLLTVDGVVTQSDESGIEFKFTEEDPEVIDRIVAFSFEHQRKERRRALDSVTTI